MKSGVVVRHDYGIRHDAFTVALNALPAVNFTVFAAGMWISAPVDGLRPVQAARCPTENEPNPTSSDLLCRSAVDERVRDEGTHGVHDVSGGRLAFAGDGGHRANQFLFVHGRSYR